MNIYDGQYGTLEAEVQREIRAETYGEDLGQASWITLQEALEWFRLLQVDRDRTVLEVACGSGGVTCRMALETGAACVGVDINTHGIEAAGRRARDLGLAPRASFQVVDAGRRLPFEPATFDAVFCNDAINHLPGREAVLADWHRILRPGGRLLFTDPIVVTGQLTSEEIRARSSIGFFLFTPVGHNESLLERCGFEVLQVRDVTGAVAQVAGRWRQARACRQGRLVPLEGAEAFQELQRFLEVVETLAGQRRLSRFMYLARRRRP